MSPSDRDTSLGLRLSSQVIRKEISLDEALLKAHSGDAVEDFTKGLNLFAGGDYFHLHEIVARLQSGDAQRAVEGRIELWELPAPVAHSAGVPTPEERTAVEALLKDTEAKIEDLYGGIQDHLRRKDLLEARLKNAPSPPTPWVSGSVILVLSLGLCGVTLFSLKSTLATAVVFLAGTGLAGVLFTKEMTRFKEFLRRQAEEVAALNRKRDAIDREIKEVKSHIDVHRMNSAKRLEKSPAFSEDEKRSLRKAHPLTFPPTRVPD